MGSIEARGYKATETRNPNRFKGTAGRYLHYFAVSASDELQSINSYMNAKKAEVIATNMAKIRIDKKITSHATKALGYNAQDAYDILTGKAFTEALNNYPNIVSPNSYSVVGEIQNIIKQSGQVALNLQQIDSDIADAIQELDAIMEQYVGALDIKKSIISDIVNAIVNGKHNVSATKVGKSVLEDLMNATVRNGSYFTFDFDKKGLPDVMQSFTRLVDAIYALLTKGVGNNKQFLSSKKQRTHTSGKVELQTVKEGIIQLMDMWGQGLDTSLYEVGKIKTALKAHVELMEHLQDVEVKQTGRGKNTVLQDEVRMFFEADERLQELYQSVPEAYNALFKGSSAKGFTNKADSYVKLTSSDNELSATYYVSAKKTDELEMDPQNSNIIKRGSFNVVSGSPLSSIIVRDARFDYDFIHNMFQVAVVHGGQSRWRGEIYDGNPNLDDLYKLCLSNIELGSLYNATIGERSGKGMMYFRLGNSSGADSFVSVYHVLSEYFRPSGENGAVGGIMTLNGPARDRKSFVAINEWVGRSEDGGYARANPGFAIERSKQVEQQALSLLHATKVDIKLSLNNFRMF